MTTPEAVQETKPTDVNEFVTDLEGGSFEKRLSIGLSQAAGSCVSTGQKAVLVVEFSFEHIGGAQVQCAHKMVLTSPTLRGDIKESDKGVTGLFVGAGGALSLLPQGMDYGRQEGLPLEPQRATSKTGR